ncbi:hypothetical protein ASPZODRAFT_980011 [Penicilliopsis zonata CBS 506.65]|uniref:Uncharacterized protein n=1 Tax=Penicilliopsis zonata CBS 506.65 TaxID=1073090 RepID=A0A1L9SR66_9EURO|nr:hypothetical protein ASPZODRAFT_980011 [Penicilliopsis zonata CBS 506.65]OJJ49596.1 hypothetical protein ASPZODRAFT_980011 [Penicilliopsis zonata CBS 506.65]
MNSRILATMFVSVHDASCVYIVLSALCSVYPIMNASLRAKPRGCLGLRSIYPLNPRCCLVFPGLDGAIESLDMYIGYEGRRRHEISENRPDAHFRVLHGYSGSI